ncbi:MAG: dihydrolipoamide acetyltransferase family protein [Pseudomonadota bacterium]
MTETTIKMPDIGEGITEAEISEWLVAPGDQVVEDAPICVVMTDKAAVEIPSPIAGEVTWCAAEAGASLPVGAPLLRIAEPGAAEQGNEEKASTPPLVEAEATPHPSPVETATEVVTIRSTDESAAPRVAASARPLAAAAVRQRAREMDLDLFDVPGSGPDGRVTHSDLDRILARRAPKPTSADDAAAAAAEEDVTEVKIIGLRRKIAEKMALSHARIPQITIVEEVDVTELERLRKQMNAERADHLPKLTPLPFVLQALRAARKAAPQVNGRYSDDDGIFRQHASLHVGIATQTARGLIVPVLRRAERLTIWDAASGIADLAARGRAGELPREALSGSTITVTSLGPLGAVATTPIVNHPEVAIVGLNRRQIRPLWDGRSFVPRDVMNISASFDHRIVDGWDAASFIARLKTVLETPALLFA